MNITDFVNKDSLPVSFSRYRAGHLYYNCFNKNKNGFEFPVPIEDTQGATFFAEHKAIEMMRYIRKAMEDGTLVQWSFSKK